MLSLNFFARAFIYAPPLQKGFGAKRANGFFVAFFQRLYKTSHPSGFGTSKRWFKLEDPRVNHLEARLLLADSKTIPSLFYCDCSSISNLNQMPESSCIVRVLRTPKSDRTYDSRHTKQGGCMSRLPDHQYSIYMCELSFENSSLCHRNYLTPAS